MKKTMILKWLAFGIEWHWWRLRKCEHRYQALAEGGAPSDSAKLCALLDRLSVHSTCVMKKTKQYEDLAGVTQQLMRRNAA